MQDSTQARTLPMLLDKIKTLFPRIIAILRRPTMNDDRQLGRTRHLHLPNENALLNIARRMIVKIVEPNLPPRNHLRIACELLKRLEIRIRRELRFMRMNPDRRINEVMRLRDLYRTIQRSRPIPSSHRKNICNPTFARTTNHFLAIWIEAGPVKMAVRINKLRRAVWLGHSGPIILRTCRQST